MNEIPWYALYSRPRHEKKLADLLNEKGIEAYVPLRKVLKQWSDRKKMVEEPLIRSYCFVRANPKWYFEALNTFGAVRYVWFSGKPAPIPDRQINTLKILAGDNWEVEQVNCNLEPGEYVKITAGPLMGTIGEITSVTGKNKLILRIDHMATVLSVTISPMMLEKLPDYMVAETKEGEKETKYQRFI